MSNPSSIDSLLEQMLELDASDLHLTTGTPPVFRIRGRLTRAADSEKLDPETTRQAIYSILTSEQQKQLELDRQIDFAYSLPGVARFRVNAYFQRGRSAAAFRLVPGEIRTLEDLGLPPVLHALAEKPRGLVLVTGPTGSGKSTTLAAIVDEINRTRAEHILTIEDPIEFLHRHKRASSISARSGPTRSRSPRALRAALRAGPRRPARRRDARPRDDLYGAHRGRDRPPRLRHSAHADRVVDDRPRHRRVPAVAAAAGADHDRELAAGGRHAGARSRRPTVPAACAALEILLPDDAVRNLVRQAKVEQLYTVMQTSSSRGMQTMEQALADLVLRQVVDYEEALARTTRVEQLLGILERAGVVVGASGAPIAAPAIGNTNSTSGNTGLRVASS